MSTRPSDRIPEQRVAAILQRAAEIDRGVAESMSRDAVRTAAIEAGISRDAVERALAEYSADEMPAPPVATPPEPPRVHWMKRALGALVEPIKFGALGLALGLTSAMGDPALVIPFFGVLTGAVHLIKRDRPTASAWRFVLAFGALAAWAATGMGAVNADIDAIASLLMLSAATLVIGTVAIKWIARRQPELHGQSLLQP